MSFLEDVRRVRADATPGALMSEPAKAWRRHTALAYRRFTRWWFAELAGLVPAALREKLVGRGNILALRLDGDTLHVGATGRVPVDAAELPPALRRRVATADAIELILPAAMVLRRTIDIPAAAAAELASAVPFLVERHTPFPPDHARTAWRKRGRADAQGRVRVELGVTAAARLDPILARLHQLDVPVARIHVEGDDRLPRLDFAAASGAGLRRPWLAEPWRPLLAASLALLLAGPPILAAIMHARAAALARSLAEHGAEPQERKHLAELLRADLALAAPLAARAAETGTVERLQQVTEALPDSSWIFSFDLTPQTLQLGGFSSDMPATVSRLQALPDVEHLEFRAPVLHDARAERDRFDILLRFAKAGHAERIPSQPNGSPAAAPGVDRIGLGVRRGTDAGERSGRPP